MSFGMVSRWLVLLRRAITPDDRDDERCLTDSAVQWLSAEARSAYFDLCPHVDESAMELGDTSIDPGREAMSDDEVTVSTNVVEVFPDRFTMTARIRSCGTSDGAATAWCSLSPAGGVSTEMRDEFIALAHGARHYH
ncbi:MAG: hypothetical protein ACLPQS_00290 [Acidimicrobiales bacterium]